MEKLYGESWAIIIAVSKLEDGSILVSDAPNAINDAKDIEQMVEKFCDFPKSKIHTLYKEQATRKAILGLIKEVCAKAGNDDRLLIFYAGHGDSEKINDVEEGYIIPFDAKGKKGKPTWESVISFNQLINDVAINTKAKQILFLIDCCFSGIACKLRGIDESTRSPVQDMINSAMKRKSVDIFTASSSDERIADRGKDAQHSIFTQKILDFVANVKAEEYKEGFVSARRMSTIVTVKTSAESWSIGKRQEPQFIRAISDQSGEFVVRKFSDKEMEEAKSKPEMEFSEIDELINEAGLYHVIQDKDNMLSIISKSTESYANRAMSTSMMYTLIYGHLKKDPHISAQLETLKVKKGLTNEKISEILNNLCINIVATGVKEGVILVAIPMETPPKRNKENGMMRKEKVN